MRFGVRVVGPVEERPTLEAGAESCSRSQGAFAHASEGVRLESLAHSGAVIGCERPENLSSRSTRSSFPDSESSAEARWKMISSSRKLGFATSRLPRPLD